MTFLSDSTATAMSAQIWNDLIGGAGTPVDRFYLQSSPGALFSSFYERPFERFSIDIVDDDATLVESLALPAHLTIPTNGYARVGLQGGFSAGDLDYNAFGDFQTLRPGNQPPDCSAAAALDPVLWPPNHRLAPVVITGISDPDGDPLTITVTSVTQDEPLGTRFFHDDVVPLSGVLGRPDGDPPVVEDGGIGETTMRPATMMVERTSARTRSSIPRQAPAYARSVRAGATGASTPSGSRPATAKASRATARSRFVYPTTEIMWRVWTMGRNTIRSVPAQKVATTGTTGIIPPKSP